MVKIIISTETLNMIINGFIGFNSYRLLISFGEYNTNGIIAAMDIIWFEIMLRAEYP